MIPRNVVTDIDAYPSAGVSHVAFVLTNREGHVFLMRPDKDTFGITATLPRVQLKLNERLSSGLERCITEKIGCEANSVYPLPQVWVTNHSTTTVFAGI